MIGLLGYILDRGLCTRVSARGVVCFRRLARRKCAGGCVRSPGMFGGAAI